MRPLSVPCEAAVSSSLRYLRQALSAVGTSLRWAARVAMGSSRQPSGTEPTPHTSLATSTNVLLSSLSITIMANRPAAKPTYVAA